ncbi:MAG: hypothetical protein KF688_12465 [Pirellulales bacterium]|nr:hypothetical protein [Pirellulales bacterium]
MSLGSQVIDELASRRELGMYFDFGGYRALRRIDDPAELAEFLSGRGYPHAPLTTDAVVAVDWLRAVAHTDAGQSMLIWMAFDPLGGILALPLWLLSRLTNRGR